MQRNLPHRSGHRCWICAAGVGFALALSLDAAQVAPLPSLAPAFWVWSDEADTRCDLRKTFTLDALPTNATVLITADNGYELYVNGSRVGSHVGDASDVWQTVERYDITSCLAKKPECPRHPWPGPRWRARSHRNRPRGVGKAS